MWIFSSNYGQFFLSYASSLCMFFLGYASSLYKITIFHSKFILTRFGSSCFFSFPSVFISEGFWVYTVNLHLCMFIIIFWEPWLVMRALESKQMRELDPVLSPSFREYCTDNRDAILTSLFEIFPSPPVLLILLKYASVLVCPYQHSILKRQWLHTSCKIIANSHWIWHSKLWIYKMIYWSYLFLPIFWSLFPEDSVPCIWCHFPVSVPSSYWPPFLYLTVGILPTQSFFIYLLIISIKLIYLISIYWALIARQTPFKSLLKWHLPWEASLNYSPIYNVSLFRTSIGLFFMLSIKFVTNPIPHLCAYRSI